MFDVRRDLLAQYGDDETALNKALDQWRKQNPIEAGTIHDVIDHIDHIVKVAGIDHVGLGSDYDGVTKLPEQLEDVSTYPYITQALLDRGYSSDDVRRILGENALRVLREAEGRARELNRASRSADATQSPGS
jgi:membrane dipeptidase